MHDLAVAWNIYSKRLHVLLKSRHVLQCSKTQYGKPAHFDRFPLGSICSVTLLLSAFHMLNVNTRLLTNDGMLKILCLEVEKLLKLLFEWPEPCVENSQGDSNARDAT